MGQQLRVAVIGAGAMGGWTAYQLQQRGAAVTLLDAWGPGHSRASSGGETRIIRSVYGPHRRYVEMTAEAFRAWRAFEARWQADCYTRTGALWLFSLDDERYLRASLPFLRAFELPIRQLDLKTLSRRYPQIGLEGVRSAWMEEEAGFLQARAACRLVAEATIKSGATYRQLAAQPGRLQNGRLPHLSLSDGSRLEADAFVFACGPWLPRLFPELLADTLQVTRQEVYFFAPPPGEAFRPPALPVWLEFGATFYYGIPDHAGRGFKIADDIRSQTHFDPEGDDRTPTPERIVQARSFLSRRFPQLAGAPLLEARVCQYTNSPDGHLIIDRHPAADNVWIAGAGTGHAFKLGPAIGRHLADLLLDGGTPADEFRLDRFQQMEKTVFNQFDVRE